MASSTHKSGRSRTSNPVFPAKAERPPDDDRQIAELDATLALAGLVRSRRAHFSPDAILPAPQREAAEELRPAPAKVSVAPNGVQLVIVPGWENIPWLWHAYSTRRGGVSSVYAAEGAPRELNLTFTPEDERDAVLRNRQLLAEALTGDPAVPIVALRQVHSDVVVVPGGPLASPACKGDGLISDRPGLLIGIQTADCIPVLVADRKRKVVAAFHAGWRGTVNRIVEKGIGRMRMQFGSQPRDLVAAVGPGIGPCCYAIGEEVHSAFESQFAYASELFHQVSSSDPLSSSYPLLFLNQRAPGHDPGVPGMHLDLLEANRRQLLDAGLEPSAVQPVGGCTSCQPDLFFSHRASHGRTGRMMSVVGIRPE